MKYHAVIGASNGDEGKGLMTDYLSRVLTNRIVVRFNGGAQAGHTVETADGVRHVFKHFGSGTLVNTPTYLSEHFLVNPVEFTKELTKLAELPRTFTCKMYIHPDAKITTPYDVMFNWAMENTRRYKDGEDCVHGSCGLGIGATEQRHTELGVNCKQGDDDWFEEPYGLFMKDLTDPVNIRQKLLKIRDEYYKEQIRIWIPEAKDVYFSDEVYAKLPKDYEFLDADFFSDDVLDDFILQIKMMLTLVTISDYEMIREYDNVIFEGAQGLNLDEGKFSLTNPHVTRSKTGLSNVEDIIWKLRAGIDIDVYYMTRSYLTRHGNGPLPWESDGVIYDGITDATNFDNHFQGALRFAPLNVRMLVQGIIKDRNYSTLKIKSTLVVTCVNQLPECVQYIDYGNKLITGTKEGLFETLKQYDTWSNIMISDSPTAESVRLLE